MLRFRCVMLRAASVVLILAAAATSSAQTPAPPQAPAPLSAPPCTHPHYVQMYDGQFVFSCYEEPHGTLLHALIAGGVALQGSDAMQTAYVLGNGGGRELNPVLQPFSGEPALFGAAKLGLAALSTWGLVKIHALPGEKARWLTVAILAEEYIVESWCIVHNENVLRDLRR